MMLRDLEKFIPGYCNGASGLRIIHTWLLLCSGVNWGGGQGGTVSPKKLKTGHLPPPPKKKWKNGGKIIKRRKIKQKIRTFYSKWAVAEIRWEKWLGGGSKNFCPPKDQLKWRHCRYGVVGLRKIRACLL